MRYTALGGLQGPTSGDLTHPRVPANRTAQRTARCTPARGRAIPPFPPAPEAPHLQQHPSCRPQYRMKLLRQRHGHPQARIQHYRGILQSSSIIRPNHGGLYLDLDHTLAARGVRLPRTVRTHRDIFPSMNRPHDHETTQDLTIQSRPIIIPGVCKNQTRPKQDVWHEHLMKPPP